MQEIRGAERGRVVERERDPLVERREVQLEDRQLDDRREHHQRAAARAGLECRAPRRLLVVEVLAPDRGGGVDQVLNDEIGATREEATRAERAERREHERLRAEPDRDVGRCRADEREEVEPPELVFQPAELECRVEVRAAPRQLFAMTAEEEDALLDPAAKRRELTGDDGVVETAEGGAADARELAHRRRVRLGDDLVAEVDRRVVELLADVDLGYERARKGDHVGMTQPLEVGLLECEAKDLRAVGRGARGR